jgi:hypothetical protein
MVVPLGSRGGDDRTDGGFAQGCGGRRKEGLLFLKKKKQKDFIH